MVICQGGNGAELDHRDDISNLRKLPDTHPSVGRPLAKDALDPRLIRIFKHGTILVEEGRKKKKPICFQLESFRALDNTSLSKQKNLFALLKRLHDDSPFFECLANLRGHSSNVLGYECHENFTAFHFHRILVQLVARRIQTPPRFQVERQAVPEAGDSNSVEPHRSNWPSLVGTYILDGVKFAL